MSNDCVVMFHDEARFLAFLIIKAPNTLKCIFSKFDHFSLEKLVENKKPKVIPDFFSWQLDIYLNSAKMNFVRTDVMPKGCTHEKAN